MSFIIGKVRKSASCAEEFALKSDGNRWFSWHLEVMSPICPVTIHSAMIFSHTQRQKHLELAQRVTALTATPDEQNLITKTHRVDGENQFL